MKKYSVKNHRLQAIRNEEWAGRLNLNIKNGHVLICSDAHYWPGKAPLMHRAFVEFVGRFNPKIVVVNGDPLDLASISRHPPIGWESYPTVHEELKVGQCRLGEIESVSGKAALIWPLGNHDARFENALAHRAAEYAKVQGIHLKDHFPSWQPCWSLFLNNDVVIKHRFKGGLHAPYNNAVTTGLSCITGHLHSAKVVPVTDYRGTRYGVDAGCIADPGHQAFNYCEDNPVNWRSGFCLLTFIGGKLMYPELITKWDDRQVQFCGEIIKV